MLCWDQVDNVNDAVGLKVEFVEIDVDVKGFEVVINVGISEIFEGLKVLLIIEVVTNVCSSDIVEIEVIVEGLKGVDDVVIKVGEGCWEVDNVGLVVEVEVVDKFGVSDVKIDVVDEGFKVVDRVSLFVEVVITVWVSGIVEINVDVTGLKVVINVGISDIVEGLKVLLTIEVVSNVGISDIVEIDVILEGLDITLSR